MVSRGVKNWRTQFRGQNHYVQGTPEGVWRYMIWLSLDWSHLSNLIMFFGEVTTFCRHKEFSLSQMLCIILLKLLILLEKWRLILKRYGMHKGLADREMRSGCSQKGGVGLGRDCNLNFSGICLESSRQYFHQHRGGSEHHTSRTESWRNRNGIHFNSINDENC